MHKNIIVTYNYLSVRRNNAIVTIQRNVMYELSRIFLQ